ncbi:NAD(P)/FAD-dependent oxidoreductase [Yunchengibacter salinarum]|uniref:NAD(P)/FAD-dependent oxidoreductase n=1 Tax=Yunchengibacter salinarum TaxID=3133399 RepID=UPI0035B57DBB
MSSTHVISIGGEAFPGSGPRRIAVVGSGISGLSAAWLLGQDNRVSLFEAESRLGGHANTVRVTMPEGPVDVDTGFIVLNDRNYPNLTRLFDALGVATVRTDMSFGVSVGNGRRRFEYAGGNLKGLLAQKRNLLRPRFWSMLHDLMRFYKYAPADGAAADPGMTLGAYLAANGYGPAFINDHLLPMAAAIWSTPQAQVDAFPMRSFTRFCDHHGLMQLTDRPTWRTVVGGARAYVDEIARNLTHPATPDRIKGTIHTGTPIRRIARYADGVVLHDAHGERHVFDDVVIATHADTALSLLAEPSDDERVLLGAFSYSRNRAVLHGDPRLMPDRREAWSAWNFLSRSDGDGSALCVSYWMNRLQPLATRSNLFVTLNPVVEPQEPLYEVDYTHPIFDPGALRAQKQLWSLQGQRHTWYCGAHFGFGFHEDGAQSGLRVAEELGNLSRPWHAPEQDGRILALSLDTPKAEAVA